MLDLAWRASAAPVDFSLLHENQPPVRLNLHLPKGLEGAAISVRSVPAVQPASLALTRALFRALDANNDGKVTRAECEAAPGLLKLFDRDEDGAITPMELVPDLLTAAGSGGRPHFGVIPVPSGDKPGALTGKIDWVLDRKEGRQIVRRGGVSLDLACDPLPEGENPKKVTLTLWVAPGPRGWFEWLDANQDGQIGPAELRGAWERLADAESKKRGWLSLPDEKGANYTLTLVVGPGKPGVRLTRPEGSDGRGPAWFRAMDRNGDGFVSRAEFLGSARDFDRLDADGDGLISPAEAEKAGGKK
jgi:Ca2+-binding EF-hand superfamily protein